MQTGACALKQVAVRTACDRDIPVFSRAERWPSTQKTARFHSYKLQARWLQVATCTFSRAGHLQCQATTDKPVPPSDRCPGSPDISMLGPELQQQWDVDRNMHLGAIKVKPNSSIKAVWQCDKCPAGQPHVWATRVCNRAQRGTKCPHCSNRLLCLHNSLATIAPDVAQYWDHSKNEKPPEQVVAGSNLRAAWKCPDCSCEWQAFINKRAHNRSGCPICSQRRKHGHEQPTFAKARPACLAEWDYERNDEVGLHPEVITLGSNKQLHWICSCCPRGQPHRWTAPPCNRVGKGQGCAVCAGHQVCVCNSLESLVPSVAAEFGVEMNGFLPSEITAQSNKKVWWKNSKRGSWKQTVETRTNRIRDLWKQM